MYAVSDNHRRVTASRGLLPEAADRPQRPAGSAWHTIWFLFTRVSVAEAYLLCPAFGACGGRGSVPLGPDDTGMGGTEPSGSGGRRALPELAENRSVYGPSSDLGIWTVNLIAPDEQALHAARDPEVVSDH